jgi:hypothetical protein
MDRPDPRVLEGLSALCLLCFAVGALMSQLAVNWLANVRPRR